MTEAECICPDYPAGVHADCPVHPNGARNLILGLAGSMTAAADQARAMTDRELGELLLHGRWTTIEIHEAGRRLKAHGPGSDYDVAKLTDRELADELANDPPRSRSDAYLDALRAEQACRASGPKGEPDAAD